MYANFERAWVSFQNSNRFRRFARHGAGAHLFRSRGYRQAYVAKAYLSSYVAARRRPEVLAGLRTFCFFIGHNKSGASMIGALLDAHPDAVVADDADALAYVDAGFSGGQLVHHLIRASRRDRLKGRVTARRLQPYSWLVPGQWQGRYNTLRVVGDSTSNTSTRRVSRDPALLPTLARRLGGATVKAILVIRNPFDPISFIMVRGRRSFENAVDHYFANCERVVALRRQMDPANLLAVHYEEFVTRPRASLTAVCRFVGLEPDDDYLTACASILHARPEQGRHLVPWDGRWIKEVETRSAQFDFLQAYSFAS